MSRPKVAWLRSEHEVENLKASASGYLSSKLLPLLQNDFEITPIDLKNCAEVSRKDFDLAFAQLEDSENALSDWQQLKALEERGPKLISYFHQFYFTQLELSFSETSVAIFSNERNRSEKRGRSACGLDYLIPYPVEDSFINAENGKRQAKQDSLSIGFCGTSGIEYRAEKFLYALEQLPFAIDLHWLVSGADLDKCRSLAVDYGVEEVEFVLGRTMENWLQLQARLDVAVHLLFSAFVDSGLFVNGSIAAGIPCLLSDMASYTGLAQSAGELLEKISPGVSEVSEIQNALTRIQQEKQQANSDCVLDYEKRKSFARESFSKKLIAEELSSIFKRSLSQS